MPNVFPIQFPIIFLILSFLATLSPKYNAKELFGINWKKKYWGQIITALLGITIIGFGTDQIAAFFGLNDTQIVEELIHTLSPFPLIAISLMILSALSEELFFRGVIQKYAGIIPNAVLFSLFHLGYGSLTVLAGSFLSGYWLGIIREKNKSIIPGFIAHSGYNILVFLLFAVW